MRKARLTLSQTELFYIIECLDFYEDYMVSHYLNPLPSNSLLSDKVKVHLDLSGLKGRLLAQRKFRCRCFEFSKRHFGFGLPY